MDDDQYLGQIMLVAGTFAPKGYLECNGQLLQISQHRDLFKLLDKRYGGDGLTTFAIPDLRGRIVCGPKAEFPLSKTTGIERNEVNIESMPAHNHTAAANFGLSVSSTDDENSVTPINNYLRMRDYNAYATTHNATMGKTTATVALQDQRPEPPVPMPNIMPSLPMIFCISLTGRFPPPD